MYIYFQQYMDEITGVSVHEVTSPEKKWYQDPQFLVQYL